ncbi:interleukin-13 receptor subunit alpha-1-like isoform X2 [Pseudophryne corroboree]|uniref:interleukin-13 receptor subunit alpha-1-like isoform X2 n=1 Tax=Pseudophryne corroboree TaxID=495146 RepID=UPI003081255E
MGRRCCSVTFGLLIAMDFLIQTAASGTGYNSTSVTDFSCVWYDMEYVNCTWTVVQDPPNTYFYFVHWEQNSSTVETNSKPSDFLDLIDTGKGCTMYFSWDRWILRCQFTIQEDLFLKLLTVVTDKFRNIKPYIFYTEARDILQFSPPIITYVNMNSSRSLYLQWSVSQNYRLMEFEVLVKMSPLGTEQRYEVKEECYKEIPNLLPEVTYTVTVRARLNEHLQGNQAHWSDWSKEITRPGTGYGISTILPIVIPLIVVVAVIILLIFLKRLKICICPSIPDPRKSFPNDLKEWIKTETPNLHNKPEKVEVYPVSLMEIPLPSAQTD